MINLDNLVRINTIRDMDIVTAIFILTITALVLIDFKKR